MAVAIASYPASEGQLREIRRRSCEDARPGVLKALVEQFDDVGENIAQVIEDALHFAFNLGTLRADFPSPPQTFQRGLKAPAEDGRFDFGETAVVAFDQ